MCAPMLPTEFLIHEKFRERFRAADIRLCLERLYCATWEKEGAEWQVSVMK